MKLLNIFREAQHLTGFKLGILRKTRSQVSRSSPTGQPLDLPIIISYKLSRDNYKFKCLITKKNHVSHKEQ